MLQPHPDDHGGCNGHQNVQFQRQCHSDDTCGTAGCAGKPVNCDDGNPCTAGDTCAAGAAPPGPLSCALMTPQAPVPRHVLPVLVFASVKLASHGWQSLPKFKEQVVSFPEVIQCFLVMGDTDFVLLVATATRAVVAPKPWEREVGVMS